MFHMTKSTGIFLQTLFIITFFPGVHFGERQIKVNFGDPPGVPGGQETDGAKTSTAFLFSKEKN